MSLPLDDSEPKPTVHEIDTPETSSFFDSSSSSSSSDEDDSDSDSELSSPSAQLALSRERMRQALRRQARTRGTPRLPSKFPVDLPTGYLKKKQKQKQKRLHQTSVPEPEPEFEPQQQQQQQPPQLQLYCVCNKPYDIETDTPTTWFRCSNYRDRLLPVENENGDGDSSLSSSISSSLSSFEVSLCCGKGWYHPTCIGLDPDQLDLITEWFCPSCYAKMSESSESSDDLRTALPPKVTRTRKFQIQQLDWRWGGMDAARSIERILESYFGARWGQIEDVRVQELKRNRNRQGRKEKRLRAREGLLGKKVPRVPMEAHVTFVKESDAGRFWNDAKRNSRRVEVLVKYFGEGDGEEEIEKPWHVIVRPDRRVAGDWFGREDKRKRREFIRDLLEGPQVDASDSLPSATDQTKVVAEYYARKDSLDYEMSRLNEVSPVEFAATKELILQEFPEHDAPLRFLDVGVGHGHYAEWILSTFPNATITLVDLCAEFIESTMSRLKMFPQTPRSKFDARPRPNLVSRVENGFVVSIVDLLSVFEDDVSPFDCILVLGPLYHLPKETDRRTALHACRSLLKPSGRAFFAGLSRVSILRMALIGASRHPGFMSGKNFDPLFECGHVQLQMGLPIGVAFVTTLESFIREISDSGFGIQRSVGLESFSVGMSRFWNSMGRSNREALLQLVLRTGETNEGRAASDHFLCICSVQQQQEEGEET